MASRKQQEAGSRKGMAGLPSALIVLHAARVTPPLHQATSSRLAPQTGISPPLLCVLPSLQLTFPSFSTAFLHTQSSSSSLYSFLKLSLQIGHRPISSFVPASTGTGTVLLRSSAVSFAFFLACSVLSTASDGGIAEAGRTHSCVKVVVVVVDVVVMMVDIQVINRPIRAERREEESRRSGRQLTGRFYRYENRPDSRVSQGPHPHIHTPRTSSELNQLLAICRCPPIPSL